MPPLTIKDQYIIQKIKYERVIQTSMANIENKPTS